MTPEQIRIAVAEACGYKVFSWGIEHPDGTTQGRGYDRVESLIPDYPADLNAIHEAEMTLNQEEYSKFTDFLYDIECRAVESEKRRWAWLSSPALARCEAFLRVKGLWKEGEVVTH